MTLQTSPFDFPKNIERLVLPQVTLCAATSVNVAATLRALEVSLRQIKFANCLLLTDAPVQAPHPEILVVPIARLASPEAYSEFILTKLVDHIESSYCLVAQWDGHVLDANRWRPEFLEYDYIGASWPQFDDGFDVGNGGFSLRSRQLMEICRDPGFAPTHPEDLAIGRINRNWLECRGIRFAPRALADSFSVERRGDLATSFGYHGVFNMPDAIGVDVFWTTYLELDERSTIRHSLGSLIKDLRCGRDAWPRQLRLLLDYVCDAFQFLPYGFHRQ